MIELRAHQQEAVDAIMKSFEKCQNKPHPCLVQLCTSAGKSYICAELARLHKSALILAPTKEIVEQNYDKLLKIGIPSEDIGICSASAGFHEVRRITVGTIGTVKSFVELLKDVEVVIIDEADNVVVENKDSQYIKFLNQLSTNKICGMTASSWRNFVVKKQFELPKVYCRPLTRIPTRKNTKDNRFGQWFWSGGIIYRCGIKRLQKIGLLAPIDYVCQDTDWSFLDQAQGRVDYDEVQLGRWVELRPNCEMFERVLNWSCNKYKRILVFAPNIAASHTLCEIATDLGYRAETIDSKNDNKKSREAKLKRFREGKTQVLFNVAVLTAGYDLPALDCVLMCRRTKSLRIWLQAIGRCVRIDSENPKKIAQVIDMAGNLKRFGKVEDIEMTQIDAKSEHGWKYKKDVIAYKPLGSKKHKILDRIS